MREELTYAEASGKRSATLILVSGYKRAGKDFVSYLLHKHLDNSVIYSYATPLKKIIADTMNISLEELDDYKNNGEYIMDSDNKTLTDFRSVLQAFGTEAMKPWFGDAVWSDVFMRQDFQEDYIIISDWRFNIEYTEAKKVYSNVITLRIIDDNIVNVDPHPSETELDDFKFDYYIDNTRKDITVLNELDKFIRSIQ